MTWRIPCLTSPGVQLLASPAFFRFRAGLWAYTVTLYGLPAAEFDLSGTDLDTRLQLTNSNPYNPVGFFSLANTLNGQGEGATLLRQGLRVGYPLIVGPGWSARSHPSSRLI